MGWNCRCPATTINKHSKNCGKEAIQQEIRLIQFPFGNLPNAGPRIDPFDFLCRLDLTYWTYWDAASCHVVSINESEYPLGNESISHLGRRKIIIIDSKLIFQGICEFKHSSHKIQPRTGEQPSFIVDYLPNRNLSRHWKLLDSKEVS